MLGFNGLTDRPYMFIERLGLYFPTGRTTSNILKICLLSLFIYRASLFTVVPRLAAKELLGLVDRRLKVLNTHCEM